MLRYINVLLILPCLFTLSGCREKADRSPESLASGGEENASENRSLASQEELELRYRKAKSRVQQVNNPHPPEATALLQELKDDLRMVTENASDVHLRANASLLLGSLYEGIGDLRSALSFYRQAHALVPEEIEVQRVLVLALVANQEFSEAEKLQEQIAKDDPDDLTAWLLLGEIRIKANQNHKATEAYAVYEMRRKGLIDGLTKKQEGKFVISPEERAKCAFALLPAIDTGTALALSYALKYEPDAKVRLAIVETMGTQRLLGYQPFLAEKATIEKDPKVKEAIDWALSEIKRDPVETRPGPAPVDLSQQTNEELSE